MGPAELQQHYDVFGPELAERTSAVRRQRVATCSRPVGELGLNTAMVSERTDVSAPPSVEAGP
jgi:hypothetical protein